MIYIFLLKGIEDHFGEIMLFLLNYHDDVTMSAYQKDGLIFMAYTFLIQ